MEKFAGYGFNKCVVAETEIIDARTGERTTVGDLYRKPRPFTIHALDDELRLVPRRVVDVMANGRKPVFKVRTAQGRSIRATGNHPFFTVAGWRTVDELRAGDLVATARAIPVESRKRWEEHEVIALAGLLAEGNTCHPTTLYFYSMTPEIIADFSRAIASFENTTARIHVRRNGLLEVQANLGSVREGDQPSYSAVVGNTALVMDDVPRRSGAFRWAQSLGITGKKATEKRIPAEVFELREGDLELFLGRLWSGDGFISDARGSAPFYATSSLGLARDVRDLLLRLRILCRIHTKSFRYRGGHRPGYTVHLVGDGARETFLKRVVPHIVGRGEQVDRYRMQVSERPQYRMSIDIVPVGAWKEIEARRLQRGWTREEMVRRAGLRGLTRTWGRGVVKRGFRRQTIQKLGRALESPQLRALGDSDVLWDRIVSIETDGKAETFDLTVEEHHNFLADGFIVHNSHSAAYALLAYQSAWLKAHHPAEFMAATMTSELADSSRIATLVEECKRMKLALLPPDVNASEWRFGIENGAIRYGLGAVRNVGQAAVEGIVQARAEGGPFRDLFDVAMRAGAKLNRRVLESLVGAGACDALGSDRATMFAGSARVLDQSAAIQRERSSGQSLLFGDDASALAVVAPALPMSEPWTGRERSAREKESLGFYLTEHPLEPLRESLPEVASHTAVEALACEDQTEVRLAGLIGDLKTFATRSGRLMAGGVIEDLSGRIECTLFPDLYETMKERLGGDEVFVISGRVEIRDLGTKVLVSEIRPYAEARETYRPVLHLEVRAEDLSVPWLERVDHVLSAHPGDCEVYLHIVMPDRSRNASRSRRYRVARGEGIVAALREDFPALRPRWGRGVP